MKLLKILLVRLLVSLVPVKIWRAFLREFFFNMYFRKRMLLNLGANKDKKFYNYKIMGKSVLIVEPNPYHGEILPGFVKYFYDLGYNVDLFLRLENKVDNPFCRFDIQPNVFSGTATQLKKLLKLKKIKEYDLVFVSSSAYWEKYFFENSYLMYLNFVPKAKYGIMLVEHHIVPCLKQYGEKCYLNSERLFTLSGLKSTPMLSPHYFGSIEITPKSNKNRFIVVGGIYKERRNYNLLLETMKELLKASINNFEIVIVGEGHNLKMPVELRKYIIFKGRLTFAKMYEEIENADFMLPLLDPVEKSHSKYLEGTTTGSRQLILGFGKPCLINNKFAKVYGFSDENSFLYKDDELGKAIKKAIQTNQHEYKAMQDNLISLADSIYQDSLNNLKKSIKRVMIKNEA
jgi:glycosyltransferase involved in cell wall biosynthesis